MPASSGQLRVRLAITLVRAYAPPAEIDAPRLLYRSKRLYPQWVADSHLSGHCVMVLKIIKEAAARSGGINELRRSTGAIARCGNRASEK